MCWGLKHEHEQVNNKIGDAEIYKLQLKKPTSTAALELYFLHSQLRFTNYMGNNKKEP